LIHFYKRNISISKQIIHHSFHHAES